MKQSPSKKQNGDAVIGGSINGNSSISVKVKHTGKDSYLNKVIRLVEEAQKTKSQTQNLADKAAKLLSFFALGVDVTTLFFGL